MKALAILLAEDEVLTRVDIKGMLERAGHTVCGECGNGLKAVELAKEKRPDLAILDIMMPGLDGLETAKALHGFNIPAVIVTAYSQPHIINRAENVYVCGYLVKPVSEQNLLATVRIAYARWQDLQQMRSELAQTQERLELQKLIARADGIIADRSQCSLQEAHRQLTQEAMRRRLSLGDLVRQIISDTSQRR